jgi:aryl-alcohol dehydrogenase-like predicted oxidoreductase
VLTLGGGGIAGEWGTTDRKEAVATVRAAHAAGINLFDVAPTYGDGEAELVVGEASAAAALTGANPHEVCRRDGPTQ